MLHLQRKLQIDKNFPFILVDANALFTSLVLIRAILKDFSLCIKGIEQCSIF